MRRIAVITGSRADHSPLKNVIRLLGDNCIHIETQGLFGHEAFIKESLECEEPDLIVLLGDRYETLVCASVAALLCIPIVHLHGGEITEAAIDDAFRHAISKLSYYHFVSHAKYKARLERLGESAERIFITGAPGMDALVDEPLDVPKIETLVCYHPETLGDDEINLERMMGEIRGNYIVAAPNNDLGSEDIRKFWESKGIVPQDYSHKQWLSLMYQATVLIGNSSSFIFEGMALGKKIIMIGDRQKGRYEDAVEFFKTEQYPYGVPGEVSPNIADLLMTLPIPKKPRKAFA